MIEGKYVLLTKVPLFRDENGTFFAETLWHKDLAAHFHYIRDLHLCCPVLPLAEAPTVPVRFEGISDKRITPLKPETGLSAFLINFLPNLKRVWEATSDARIVHSGFGGGPFPVAFFVPFIKPFQNFKFLAILESDTWIITRANRFSLSAWIRYLICELLVRWCLRIADARIFTHVDYRDTYLKSEERSLIAPAVWVDSEHIAPEPAPTDLEGEKKSSAPFRLVLAARLIPTKGIETVLRCIEFLEEIRPSNARSFRIDVIGSGRLEARCRAFCEGRSDGAVTARLCARIPYGPAFFDFIRDHDALLCANIKNEQPRVIYDGYSQGLPCIATATQGNRASVREGESGFLVPINGAREMAEKILEMASSPRSLAVMKRNALRIAHAHTHQEMHKKRERFIENLLGAR